MPSQSRAAQVDPETTPYYHCMNRCVRRAFLMGIDEATGKSFDHRKAWVEEELAKVCETFAIDCCAYAVMSNHLHTVVRIDVDRSSSWSSSEIYERAKRLWPMAAEQLKLSGQWEKRDGEYRERLSSLSWFMRVLNERIARRANREDGVTGRFWEGRFKSRPLLDEGALLACMAYVDLNPIRAGLSESLSDSDFTSIAARLAEVGERVANDAVSFRVKQHAERQINNSGRHNTDKRQARRVRSAIRGRQQITDAPRAAPRRTSVPLMPFASTVAITRGTGLDVDKPSAIAPAATATKARRGGAGDSDAVSPTFLPMELGAYVELLRFTGQAVRGGDTNSLIPQQLVRVLSAVGLDERQWLHALQHFPTERFAALGECHLIRAYARGSGKQHGHGIAWAKNVYQAVAA